MIYELRLQITTNEKIDYILPSQRERLYDDILKNLGINKATFDCVRLSCIDTYSEYVETEAKGES